MCKHTLPSEENKTSERSSSQEVLFLLTWITIAYFSEGSSKSGDLFSVIEFLSMYVAKSDQTRRRHPHSHLVGTGSTTRTRSNTN